jgi:serralysin
LRLSGTSVDASELFAGAAAADGNDFLIYDSSGHLFYDSNGNAAGGLVQFATVSGHPVLGAADFVVV